MTEPTAISQIRRMGEDIAVLREKADRSDDLLMVHAAQSRETLVAVTQIAAKQLEIAAAIEQNRISRQQLDERFAILHTDHTTLATQVATTRRNTIMFGSLVAGVITFIGEALRWFGTTIGVTTPHH